MSHKQIGKIHAASGKRYGWRLRTWARLGLFMGCAASLHSALAAPIGYIDGVRKKDGYWAINGWACEPGLGSAIQVRLFMNNGAQGMPQFSNEAAEDAIHQLCGTAPSSGVPYRFTLRYDGAIGGQNIRVDGMGTAASAPLHGSNQFGLPLVDPESVIAAASKILVLTAHEDDETWFSPVLGKYCANKACRVVTATSARDSDLHPEAGEFENAMAFLPAAFDRGTFSTVGNNGSIGSPQTALNDWSGQARDWGLVDLNNVVKLEIDKFVPDVILTFDPRHGTSCHPQHRAVGQAVIDGVRSYAGANFNKANLFLLTSRRIDTAQYTASVPATAIDRHSVIYDMGNYVPARAMSGFDFLLAMLEKYPTQFKPPAMAQIRNSDATDRVVGLLPIGQYVADDSRYGDSHASDPRIENCPAFQNIAPGAEVPSAPTIGSVSGGNALLSVAFTPAALGSGTLLNYTASCGGMIATGTSSPILLHGLSNGRAYSCQVKTTSSAGASLWSAVSNTVTPAAPVIAPSAPAIGTAVAGVKAASVAFTPGAQGSGMLVNYTARCGAVVANGARSPIIVNGLISGSPTTCQVKTSSTVGDSPWSAVSNAVTPLAQPALPSAPSIGAAAARNGAASVAFTPGAPGTGTLSSYTANCGAMSATGSSSPITVSGLSNGTAYGCRVKTTTSVGSSAWSAWSNQVTPVPQPALPSAPAIGTASAGNGAASVAFTPGALGAGTLVNYLASCGGISASGNASPIAVAGLSNGSVYSCQVRTVSSVGAGPWSAWSNSVTPQAPVVLPTTPTIGSAVAVGYGGISVSFTPGALGSGTFISHTAMCGGIFVTGTSSPITVTGLAAGTPYFCQVKTTSSVGESPRSEWSNPVFM